MQTFPTNHNQQELNPMEERSFVMTAATMEADGTRIDITSRETETDSLVIFRLPLKRYDFESRKWIDDDDVAAASEKIAQERFGKTMTDLPKSFGLPFTGYTNGETGTFSPSKPYINFDKIEPADAKQLKKMQGPFGLLPITESDSPSWARFNFGLLATMSDGTCKKFRVSQIAVESDDENEPDEIITLRYSSKMVRTFTEALEKENFPAEAREALMRDINDLLIKERAKKIEKINRALGIDLEKLLEGEETVKFDSVEVKTIGDSYYLVGTLVK